MPSSWPIWPPSDPGGASTGAPGGAPKLVVTCEPGRVTFCVWPWPFTVILSPNTKVEVVCVGCTLRMVMPPRMPMVLAGVVMEIGLSC